MTDFIDNFDDSTIGPEWTIRSGSWSESNSALVIAGNTADGRITTPDDSPVGEWEITFRDGGAARVAYDAAAGVGYEVRYSEDTGGVDIRRIDSGGTTTLTSVGGASDGDTVTVVREGAKITVTTSTDSATLADDTHTTADQFEITTPGRFDATEIVDRVEIASGIDTPTLSATVDGESVALSWTTTYAADHAIYRAEESGSQLSDYSRVDTSGSATNYTDTGLEAGERYYYRVVPIGFDGTERTARLSGEASATAPLPAPSIVDTTDSAQGEITVDYTTQDNAADGGVDILDNGSLVETRDLPSRALSFDGVDDVVQSSTVVDVSPITIDCWFKTNNPSQSLGWLVNVFEDAGNAWGVFVGNGDIVIYDDIDGVDNRYYNTPISANQWYHVEATLTETAENILSVDGLQVGSGETSTATIDSFTGNVFVGGRGDQNNFTDATIGYVELRSGGETFVEYSLDGDGPVAWDSSGNQHHGDIQGATRVDGPPELGDPPTATLTGLPEASQHDITVRRTTDHTSTDSATDTQFSKPSAPTGTQVDRISDVDQLKTSWADQSGGEDGYRVFVDGSIASGDLDPNTETFTTASLQRGATHTVTPQAFVGSGSEAATADGPTVTQRLPDATTTQTAGEGYTVELEQSDGTTIRPSVVGEPERIARLNDLPEIRLPVAQSDHYNLSAFEEATMRVWTDGRREPIERLRDVEQSDGETVLVGIGGVELERTVQEQVLEKENHVVARDLVQQETSYATNVDNPQSDTTDGVVVQSADDTATFGTNFGDNTAVTDGTVPLRITDGALTAQQVGYVAEIEDTPQGSSGGGWSESTTQDANTSDQRLIVFDGVSSGTDTDSDGQLETFIDVPYVRATVDHDIPAGDAEVWLRIQTPTNGDHLPYKTRVTGDAGSETVRSQSADVISTNGWVWQQQGVLSQGLSAGDTVEVRVGIPEDTGSENLWVDVAAVVDGRYDVGFGAFANDLGPNGRVKGPAEYPLQIDAITNDAQTVQQVVAGELTSTWSGFGPNQQVAISNDQGDSYATASGGGNVTAEFGTGTGQLRARFRLSCYTTSEDTTPYYSGQPAVSAYSLSATLDDTPIIINRLYEDDLVAVLQEVADRADALWQLVWTDGGLQFEYTQAGQRNRDDAVTVSSFEATKQTKTYSKAIVKGPSKPVDGEQVTFDTGTQSLLNDFVQEASETVRSTDGTTTYVRDTDYSLNELNGEITRLPTGDIGAGETVEVAYEYKTRGSYTSPDHSGDPEDVFVETIPAVTTDRNADQAALILVKNLDTPRWTASATLDDVPPDWRLLETVGLNGVDIDTLEVYSTTQTPDGTRLQLGSRSTPEEVVQRIQEKLSSTAQRT